MYQKSIKHVSYDSLRPNERAGTKKFCKKFLSYIDPFDNCVLINHNVVEQHLDALDFSYFFITDAPLSKDDAAAFKQRLFLAPKRSLKSLDDVLNFHLPHSDQKMRNQFRNYMVNYAKRGH